MREAGGAKLPLNVSELRVRCVRVAIHPYFFGLKARQRNAQGFSPVGSF